MNARSSSNQDENSHRLSSQSVRGIQNQFEARPALADVTIRKRHDHHCPCEVPCHAGRMLQPLSIPVGATAQRPAWGELPTTVRARVVEVLGSIIVQAKSQRSGFTPGFASRLW